MAFDVDHFREAFTSYLVRHQLLSAGGSTLIAVSGGVDSVVLSDLFAAEGLPFAMAYCYFSLRKEADQEQDFVESLARNYGVPFFTTHFDTRAYARRQQVSIQMAARELRYRWFEGLLAEESHGLRRVATAHHLDDAIETLLRNFTKGTGITGLHGILPMDRARIRPLLFTDKEAIHSYAGARRLSWCTDSSNSELMYDRNFLRHQVVPKLLTLNPGLTTTFQTTLARLQQVEKLFQAEVTTRRQQLWHTELPYHYISVGSLIKEPWAGVVLEAWLSPFGFHLKQLYPWIMHPPQTGKRLESATHWLLADRERWVVGPHHACWKRAEEGERQANSLSTLLPREEGTRKLPGRLCAPHAIKQTLFERAGYTLPSEPSKAALDLALLRFPLTVRPWQKGDFYYPLTGKSPFRKKVSDLLIDAKVPLHEKPHVQVVLSEGKIVWVVGHSVDDRFKVSDHTSHVWELSSG